MGKRNGLKSVIVNGKKCKNVTQVIALARTTAERKRKGYNTNKRQKGISSHKESRRLFIAPAVNLVFAMKRKFSIST